MSRWRLQIHVLKIPLKIINIIVQHNRQRRKIQATKLNIPGLVPVLSATPEDYLYNSAVYDGGLRETLMGVILIYIASPKTGCIIGTSEQRTRSPHNTCARSAIKDHSKDWKITYAGDWHPELKSLLDDYSPIINTVPSLQEIQERKSKGLTTTYYVCCTPAKPNNFVFSPPVESTYIGWYTAAYGFDGFLRWAYDAWPAGDCFMVYHGGVSNIRFEKLREGIIDFEKIRIIRELAAKSPDKKVKNLASQFDKHLTTFIGDRDYSKREYNASETSEAVSKGKKMIDEMSNMLSPQNIK